MPRDERYGHAMEAAWDLRQAVANLSGDAKAREVMAPVLAWIEANYGPSRTTPGEPSTP
jgi:hypothetical protein